MIAMLVIMHGTIRAIEQLNLDRGVGQAEALAQPGLDCVDRGVRISVFAKARVERHHGPLLRDRPRMDVMNVLDLGDGRFQVGFDFFRRKPGWGAFDQDMA
jgi:hypothetical protein